jgi:hypothetical protein
MTRSCSSTCSRGLSAGYRGQQRAPMPAGWDAVEARLAQSGQAEVPDPRPDVVLSLTFGSQRAMDSLRATAWMARPMRGRAGRRSRRWPGTGPSIAGVVEEAAGRTGLRGLALRRLGAFDDADIPGLALGLYGALPGAERRDALNTLAGRASFAGPLLDAVAAGKVPRADLTAELIRQLKNLRTADSRPTAAWPRCGA